MHNRGSSKYVLSPCFFRAFVHMQVQRNNVSLGVQMS